MRFRWVHANRHPWAHLRLEVPSFPSKPPGEASAQLLSSRRHGCQGRIGQLAHEAAPFRAGPPPILAAYFASPALWTTFEPSRQKGARSNLRKSPRAPSL
jgi:hypothetical protein